MASMQGQLTLQTLQVCTHRSFRLGIAKSKRVAMTMMLDMLDMEDAELAKAGLDTLRSLFDKADADGSGFLDVDELGVVVRDFYSAEGRSRSAKVVRKEVAAAMESFDTDGNGLVLYAVA